MSASAAIKLVRRVRETGSTKPARIGGYRKPLLAGHADLLRDLMTGKPGITLAEISEGLVARGIALGCLTTIWSTFHRLACHKLVAPRINLKAKHPVKVQRCRGQIGRFNNC